MAAGLGFSMVLKQDNSVWAAGRNDRGQMGFGAKVEATSFVQVVAAEVKSLAALTLTGTLTLALALTPQPFISDRSVPK